MLAPWKESYEQPWQHIKKQRHYFASKGPSSQSYGFSSSHVWIWELDYKESWALKNWCFWTVVLEKTLESPLDCKEIQPVHPEGNQSWIFIGRTDVEAETPIFCPPDVKNWLIRKESGAGKLKAGGEGDDRGWDGWMASLTQRTWVWVSSGRWWWKRKSGVLQSMGLQSWTWLRNWIETENIKIKHFVAHNWSLSRPKLWIFILCECFNTLGPRLFPTLTPNFHLLFDIFLVILSLSFLCDPGPHLAIPHSLESSHTPLHPARISRCPQWLSRILSQISSHTYYASSEWQPPSGRDQLIH